MYKRCRGGWIVINCDATYILCKSALRELPWQKKNLQNKGSLNLLDAIFAGILLNLSDQYEQFCFGVKSVQIRTKCVRKSTDKLSSVTTPCSDVNSLTSNANRKRREAFASCHLSIQLCETQYQKRGIARSDSNRYIFLMEKLNRRRELIPSTQKRVS